MVCLCTAFIKALSKGKGYSHLQCRCFTAKCVDNSLLHSTRVTNCATVHEICSTEDPFDLRCESVTCIIRKP